MPFKVHARSVAVLRGRQAVPPEAVERMHHLIEEKRAEVLTQREAVCRACKFWFDELGRCMHHKCGCPRSMNRLRPWAILPRCPDGKW